MHWIVGSGGFAMTRMAGLTLLLLGVGIASGCADGVKAEAVPRGSVQEERFDHILAKYQDLTFQQLAGAVPKRDFIERLSFEPAEVEFYDEAVNELQLTDVEQAMLQENGFVSVDHDQRYSFGSLYFAIYTRDLPVLVTTDSVLHAMHRTYDDILMEMEQTFFTAALNEMLGNCHDELASKAPKWGATAKNYQDVDLYLTVARNLLRGAGAATGERIRPGLDAWDGSLLVNSMLDQDDEVKEILDLVQSLTLQSPLREEFTTVYGGKRAIDYSQFKPRGHYTKSAALSRYFRAMMWLGRADTGWNILPPDRQSGIVSDTPRELRNAIVLTRLLESTGGIERLKQMRTILDFMVGESDNLGAFQMIELLRQQNVDDTGDLVSSGPIQAFQNALISGKLGEQQIRSQVVLSDPRDLHQVPPPSTFQLFGQGFVVDSFVLSKVVYDSIIFDGQKVERTMPTGLDVMFALGNDTVLPILKKEMTELPYAANLKASQEFVAQLAPSFWQENLYNIWLDALRTLQADLAEVDNAPESMRTAPWQRKQLQTQLASWAELRHNTVLYAKPSYTAGVQCEYPAGYVEPYPETYARVRLFAEEAARRIEAANFNTSARDFSNIQQRQVAFLKQMAETVGRLERLARQELAAEPFAGEDQEWLKKVIDIRGGGSGPPKYDGWYCQLFYGGGQRSAEWDPTVVDVHTDPNDKSVLEQGVGNCNFLVVAIDNEDDRMVYVGPAYSYYEFRQPADSRLTDPQWQDMLQSEKAPPRPAWTRDFQAPKSKRSLTQITRPRGL
jgi:hypothetical protein